MSLTGGLLTAPIGCPGKAASCSQAPRPGSRPLVPSKPKPSWPLLLLAALSFLPGIGFFFASAAVAWALVSDRPRARIALGLGAAGALLQIVAIVVLIITLRDDPAMRRATRATTVADLNRLVVALDRYKANSGRYPATLQELAGYPIPLRMLNIYDQSAGPFHVRPYLYRLAADGRSFDLRALGPDGRLDTPDDIHPELPDSLAAHSGYRPSE